MYRTILVPTDGSPVSGRAADHAISLARKYDAALRVLYVVELDAAYSESLTESVLDSLEAYADDAVAKTVERARAAGIEDVDGDVARGTPHRVILDYAHQHGVDLVVMGTHGRRGLDRLVLGSVAGRVVRTSDIPVMTVRGGEVGADEATP